MSWSWRALMSGGEAMTPAALVAERWRLLRLLAGAGWSSSTMLILLLLLQNLALAATALAVGYAVSQAEVAVQTGDVVAATWGLVALGLVVLGGQAAENAAQVYASSVRLRIDGGLRQRARAAAAAMPTLVELGERGRRGAGAGHRGIPGHGALSAVAEAERRPLRP